MTRGLVAVVLIMEWSSYALASNARTPQRIELVNSYSAAGPRDISGSIPANKVLRAMQNHAVPPVTDALGRRLQQALAYSLDTPVDLVRRARESGREARRYVAASAPDGRTLLIAGSDMIVGQPLIGRDNRYEPARNLAPVSQLARMPMVLIAAVDIPSVKDLIEAARVSPSRTHLGSTGGNTTAHLAGALLERATKANFDHVPFNGAHSAVRAVIRDEVRAAFIPLPAVLPYIANVRLKALAITDVERHPAVPHVPTMAQAGIAGVEVSGWYGLFAPAATPLDIIERIQDVIESEQRSPGFVHWLAQHGLSPAHGAHRRFADLIRGDGRRWRLYVEMPAAP